MLRLLGATTPAMSALSNDPCVPHRESPQDHAEQRDPGFSQKDERRENRGAEEDRDENDQAEFVE